MGGNPNSNLPATRMWLGARCGSLNSSQPCFIGNDGGGNDDLSPRFVSFSQPLRQLNDINWYKQMQTADADGDGSALDGGGVQCISGVLQDSLRADLSFDCQMALPYVCMRPWGGKAWGPAGLSLQAVQLQYHLRRLSLSCLPASPVLHSCVLLNAPWTSAAPGGAGTNKPSYAEAASLGLPTPSQQQQQQPSSSWGSTGSGCAALACKGIGDLEMVRLYPAGIAVTSCADLQQSSAADLPAWCPQNNNVTGNSSSGSRPRLIRPLDPVTPGVLQAMLDADAAWAAVTPDSLLSVAWELAQGVMSSGAVRSRATNMVMTFSSFSAMYNFPEFEALLSVVLTPMRWNSVERGWISNRPRDTFNCSSTTAFAVISAAEAALRAAGLPDKDLSEGFLYSCRLPQPRCDGYNGSLYDMVTAFTFGKAGLPNDPGSIIDIGTGRMEGCLNYKPQVAEVTQCVSSICRPGVGALVKKYFNLSSEPTVPCLPGCSESVSGFLPLPLDYRKPMKGRQTPIVPAIQAHIRRFGAIVTTMLVYPDFLGFLRALRSGQLHGKDSVYKRPAAGVAGAANQQPLGKQGIAIVGYDNWDSYYLAQIFYGPSFGDNGVVKISYVAGIGLFGEGAYGLVHISLVPEFVFDFLQTLNSTDDLTSSWGSLNAIPSNVCINHTLEKFDDLGALSVMYGVNLSKLVMANQFRDVDWFSGVTGDSTGTDWNQVQYLEAGAVTVNDIVLLPLAHVNVAAAPMLVPDLATTLPFELQLLPKPAISSPVVVRVPDRVTAENGIALVAAPEIGGQASHLTGLSDTAKSGAESGTISQHTIGMAADAEPT
eukprot:gene9530-9693_t